MKQVEIEVVDEKLPIDVYDILYGISPEGFIERQDDKHRFVLFVNEEDLFRLVSHLEQYEWINTINIGQSVEESGWLKSWRENYKPIVVPPFKIIPSWLKETEPTGGFLPIYINSGIAFGTGEHETTRLCLRLLSQTPVKDKRVLDIGTGSGILAIAASLLGARSVDAFDLDPIAVEVARENISLNGIDNISVFRKDAFQYSGGHYDIVLANLVWSILSEIPHKLKDTVKDGFLIVSGILREQKGDFISLYERIGFQYVRHIEEGEWVGVLLRG